MVHFSLGTAYAFIASNSASMLSIHYYLLELSSTYTKKLLVYLVEVTNDSAFHHSLCNQSHIDPRWNRKEVNNGAATTIMMPVES